jgi:hypothetical protein
MMKHIGGFNKLEVLMNLQQLFTDARNVVTPGEVMASKL